MARSNNSGSAGSHLGSELAAKRADGIALGSLAVGLVLYVIPWWNDGRLRLAFWLTLLATLLHIVTSHRRGNSEAG